MASDTFIPAGTKLRVSFEKDYGFGDASEPAPAPVIVDEKTGKKYSLKNDARKSAFVEKKPFQGAGRGGLGLCGGH